MQSAMQYCHLGRSGLRVSRFCLGTFNFGLATGESDAHRIMDGALEAGINFFDTANHYPDFVHCGLSEQVIGRWFAAAPGRRVRRAVPGPCACRRARYPPAARRQRSDPRAAT